MSGMSTVEMPFDRVADYEAVPSDDDQNVSQNWALQNTNFSRTLSGKIKQVPKISVPCPLPSLFDGPFMDSPRNTWRSFEEQVYNPVSSAYPSQAFNPVSTGYSSQGFNPVSSGYASQVFNPSGYLSPGFCEAETFGSDIQAALRSLSSEAGGKSSVGSELEHSSSSDVMNHAGAMDLAFPASDDREAQGCRESFLDNTGDGQWEGVVKLVQDLNLWFNDSNSSVEFEGSDQKSEKVGAQSNPNTAPPSAQELKNLEVVKKNCCGEDILNTLTVIQQNVEKIREAVPKIAGKRHNFTVLVHRQCAAAVGAVKLISQLAEAAVAIIPEILREVDTAVSHSWVSTDVKDPCKESFDKSKWSQEECSPAGSSPVSSLSHGSSGLKEEAGVGEAVGMDSLAPTMAAVSMTAPDLGLVNPVCANSTMAAVSMTDLGLANPVCENSDGAAEETKVAVQLGPVAENDCASSLVADLLSSPCPRMTPGVGGFIPTAVTSSTPFRFGQWGNDLEQALPFENSEDRSTSGTTGGSKDEPTPSDSGAGAPQDESDEGDTKGSIQQLSPGSFTLMEIDDIEILTEQTHYCNICSKGFKRDANLRMHMRSHGGKYKASAALVRSERAPKVVQEVVDGKLIRYSCPYAGCNRNMKHPKFQALKTMLCLKNHYRRSHCAKTLQCSICKSKQFSVVADLKTHEKHCGSDKWACSCGTTFSRKEKLIGHVSLFVGHAAVSPSTVHGIPISDMSGAPLQAQLDGSLAANQDASAVPTENEWKDW